MALLHPGDASSEDRGMNQPAPRTGRHLIVGDGPIGLATAQALHARGQEVTLASRSAPKAAAYPHLRLDALDAGALKRAAQGYGHIHLTLGLPYRTRVWQRDWPRVMRGAIDAALTHGALLVWFDNVYAYGPSPLQVPMRENHPIAPASRKGAVRAALLEMLREADAARGLRWLVARSADFYGPGVRLSMLYALAVQRQLQGRAAWWLGDPDKRHSFTYVPDAGLALALLALDEGAWRQTWHLPTHGHAPTPRQLLAETARLLGAPAQVHAIPPGLTRAMALFSPPLAQVSEMLYQFRHDYVFSSEKFMARYPGFRITPHAEGLARMVDSLRPAGRA